VKGSFLVFAAALLAYALTYAGPTPHVEHVIQAWALLHGHTHIDTIPVHEQVVVGGHAYILHPPLSAIILIPYVALRGLAANQTMASVLLGSVAVALVYRMTRSLWFTVFFGLGTPFWYEATLGASWGFCLVLSTVPTLLALTECFGKQRAWLVGAWAGLAVLARYDLVMVWPVYAALLLSKDRNWRRCLWLLPGFASAAALCVLYNEIRFGTVTDPSLWLWYQLDEYGWKLHPGGPFNLHNLPWNLYTAVFMPPIFTPQFPWIRPWLMGQSLLFTSPAFLLTLRAPWRRLESWLLWIAVLLAMGASMTVYSNGFVQFGARYWIQVFPFLLALMALDGEPGQDGKLLIAASVAMMAFGIWQIRVYGFAGEVIS
jgi:hypothetical protein